ncbi:putative CtpA-like serine protease [subsurface metagenome]
MPKITRFALSILLVVIIVLVFGVGFVLGGRSPSTQGEGLDIVGQAWNIIFTDFVDKGQLDSGELSRAAIEGMIEKLDDPYTSYLEDEDFQLGLTELEGEFNGIGAHVGIKDDRLTIIAPITGTPAAEAGIRAGDIILEIDGTSTEGMSLVEAVLKIRGPRGTPVTLLVLHQGETEPEEIEIIRDKIEVASVSFEMKGDIAHISIAQFSERTDEELATALQSITEQQARGIILDLRSNPGGLLEAVVNVASLFLPEGVVVKVVSNHESPTALTVQPGKVTTDLPMVVLVDEFSASGSEVLAGALQDHGRATIAGTTTYGKGSVNILRQLSDGSGLYITTARWLTPNGRLIEAEGIDPDHTLELSGEDTVQWALDYLKGNR